MCTSFPHLVEYSVRGPGVPCLLMVVMTHRKVSAGMCDFMCLTTCSRKEWSVAEILCVFGAFHTLCVESQHYFIKGLKYPLFSLACFSFILKLSKASFSLPLIILHVSRLCYNSFTVLFLFFQSLRGSDFTCGCLLRNSKFFASGSSDSTVRIWDLKKKSVFRTCRVRETFVTC